MIVGNEFYWPLIRSGEISAKYAYLNIIDQSIDYIMEGHYSEDRFMRMLYIAHGYMLGVEQAALLARHVNIMRVAPVSDKTP